MALRFTVPRLITSVTTLGYSELTLYKTPIGVLPSATLSRRFPVLKRRLEQVKFSSWTAASKWLLRQSKFQILRIETGISMLLLNELRRHVVELPCIQWTRQCGVLCEFLFGRARYCQPNNLFDFLIICFWKSLICFTVHRNVLFLTMLIERQTKPMLNQCQNN